MKANALIALAFAAGGTPAFAHHSASALFHLDEELVLEGAVSEFRMVNPHARIYLDVTNASGTSERWMAEGGTPLVLMRLGWTGEEVKPGDVVKIKGNPSRDGSNVIHWVTIKLPDGRELYGEDIDFGALDRRRRQQQRGREP